MKLQEHNELWTEFLASENCPPVLGLAPMSEPDKEEIEELVRERIQGSLAGNSFDHLLQLIDRFPGVMTVWLLRMAGEAYQDGNFWSNFGRIFDIEITVQQRKDLVSSLKQNAFLIGNLEVISAQIEKNEYRKWMMWQAGLPLCHAGNFARTVRWVEREYGLPDPDQESGVEEMQNHLQCFSHMGNWPILKQAIAGPAGPIIAEAALRVVFQDDALRINPRISDELQQAFADLSQSQIRRSPIAPQLRLGGDYSSIELICPRQPGALVGENGFSWEIDGETEWVDNQTETVFPASLGSNLNVELHGQDRKTLLSREFDLDLEHADRRFLVFDGGTLKERRWQGDTTFLSLPEGSYFVVCPDEVVVCGAEDEWPWGEGNFKICCVALSPGTKIQIEDGERRHELKLDQKPFFRPCGRGLVTDDLDVIGHSWTGLPEVWTPDDGHTEEVEWQLRITIGDDEHTEPLKRIREEGEYRVFAASERVVLDQLNSGMHRLVVSVHREGRRRAEHQQAFWYWKGLSEYREGDAFALTAPPANLAQGECQGFDISENEIRHTGVGRRQHRLAFQIGEQIREFRWSRSGVFLERVEKRAGHILRPEPLELGASLTATIESREHLRIWKLPVDGFAVLFNGNAHRSLDGDARKSFVDISLADMAARHSAGGKLEVECRGLPIHVADVLCPLVPRSISCRPGQGYDSVRFEFLEEVRRVRPKVTNLITNESVEFDGQEFGTSGHCCFESETLPTLEIANTDPSIEHESERCPIAVNAPMEGWPEGVWLVELEVQKDSFSPWETIRDDRGGRAPLVLITRPEQATGGLRQRFLWHYFGVNPDADASDNTIDKEWGTTEGCAKLLKSLGEFLESGFHDAAWSKLRSLEIAYFELGRQAAREILNGCSDLAAATLANLADEAEPGSSRSVLRETPELAALPAHLYTGLKKENPFCDSLHWIGLLGEQESVIGALFSTLMEYFSSPTRQCPGLVSVLNQFENCTQVLQQNDGSIDFAGFSFTGYLAQVIGPIRASDLTKHDVADLGPLDRLGPKHARLSVGHAAERHKKIHRDDSRVGEANAVFALAPDMARWLRDRLGSDYHLLPAIHWQSPWLDVDIEDDVLTVNLNQFASMFALSCRLAAHDEIQFADVIDWLKAKLESFKSVRFGYTTLFRIAPELLGFYLLFWELMIRTRPHR